MDHDNFKNVDFQTREYGGVNIEVEANDTMEEDQDDEEDDDQDDHDDQDDDDAKLDVPLLEKAHQSLYEGSKTTLLVVVLLLVNLKVMNDLSNIEVSCMLRYVIFFYCS